MIRPRQKILLAPATLLKRNPFADLQSAHEEIVKKEDAMSYEARLKDWNHVKPSTNGSASPKKRVTISLPVSGSSITI